MSVTDESVDRVSDDTSRSSPAEAALRVLPYVLLLGLLLIAPHTSLLSPYWVYVGSLILVNAIAALGLSVSLGFVRLLNVATAGLMGVGAYTVAILLQHGNSYPLAVVGGAASACLTGAVIGAFAARVRTHYFLIVTIGAQQALVTAFTQWKSLTGGALGMHVEHIHVGSIDLASKKNVFMLASLLFVVGLYAAQRLKHSRPGRAMVALGQSETAAHSVGISSQRYNVFAMAVAGFYAGIAGAVFVPLVGFVAPESFGLGLSILMVAMLVIGGLGSNIGTVIGVVVLSLINERLRSVTNGAATLSYGLAIMVLVVVAPGGLATVGRRLWRLVR